MELQDLRIALFSGNYNYVRDGANQALNRLVGYLLRQGSQVRVYAPVIARPAFEPTGTLIGLPSLPLPVRHEYRMPLGLSPRIRRDLAQFAPNMMHVSSPDFSGQRAVSWARKRNMPILASVHTRFETYMRYYKLGFTEPLLEAILRRFYRRCDALVAPSESMSQVLREQRMHHDISIWSRGVDRETFHSGRRDNEWRRGFGIGDDEIAVGFLGRLVMEKGLDVFADTLAELRKRGIKAKVLVVGDGPARSWLESHLPDAAFAGFQSGDNLGRAVASMDVLFNPSVTETFGNVTLEAMACGLPVVASIATGSESLVTDGVSGRLIEPGAIRQFADALGTYVENPDLRHQHGLAGELRSQDFDWDRINHAVAECYLRLVRQRQAQGRTVRG